MSSSKLAIGIVGLPNVGKSTLFNALTNRSVPAENYPFCTIDPSVGIVAVPDRRLGELAALSHSKKTIPAVIEFVDIAGLVAGASAGEGLGNKFLTNIRETDAILEVVRCFRDSAVLHVSESVDPVHDIEVVNLELVLADAETVKKRLDSIARLVKQGDAAARKEHAALERIAPVLDVGNPARVASLTEDEALAIKSLNLLTLKPIFYALNRKGSTNVSDKNPTADVSRQSSATADTDLYEKALDYLRSQNALSVSVDILTEHDFKGMDALERSEFRKEIGLSGESGIDELIRTGYELLDLITFFTTGEDETRAWTIARGSTAPIAGTAIHTDFRDKFIRAEVIASGDLIRAGSYAAAREKGRVATCGKDYIVNDGDVIEFKI